MADDDLTERITRVLGEHQPGAQYLISGGLLVACRCGWQTNTEHEHGFGLLLHGIDVHRAHQAEQVRAVLGETTTEWGVRWVGGGPRCRGGVPGGKGSFILERAAQADYDDIHRIGFVRNQEAQ